MKEIIKSVIAGLIIVFALTLFVVYYTSWVCANWTIEYERKLEALRKYEAKK